MSILKLLACFEIKILGGEMCCVQPSYIVMPLFFITFEFLFNMFVLLVSFNTNI